MSTELKDCPFCGSKPTMKHIGNDHTKSRAVEVRCSNIECRVARTDKAFRNDHAWLTAVAVEGWNRRPALAASGGNAAPGLTDEQILAIQVQHIPPHGWSTNGIAFARAIEAASAPNAALVAALQGALAVIDDYLAYTHDGDPWKEDARSMGEMDINDADNDGRIESWRAALSAAGQEVGK